jgi:hypothetical protein
MTRLANWIEWRTITGAPVVAGEYTVRPQTQMLVIRPPSGGLVWSRPVAVLAEHAGHTRRIRIVDVTRVVQLGMLIAGLGAGLVLRRIRPRAAGA